MQICFLYQTFIFSIFILSICFYYEILPRSLERKRVSLWPLTSDTQIVCQITIILQDQARPVPAPSSELRANKINSAGLEDYYFSEWTFQALQPLLLLLTVEKIYDWLVCSESVKTSKYDWHHLSALTVMPISGQAAKIFWSEMCFQYYKFR